MKILHLLQANNINIHLAFVGNRDNLAGLAAKGGKIGRGTITYHGAENLGALKPMLEDVVRSKTIDKIVCLAPSEPETTAALDVADEHGIDSVVFYHGADDPAHLILKITHVDTLIGTGQVSIHRVLDVLHLMRIEPMAGV